MSSERRGPLASTSRLGRREPDTRVDVPNPQRVLAAAFTMPALPESVVRPVVTAPARVLSTPGQDVDPSDPAVVQLAADLLATQRVSPGCVGLAAQQVGLAWRVFSVDVSAHPKTRTCHGAFVLCNAELLESSRRERGREGCMSVPDLTGDVKRARRVVVRGQLPVTGETVTLSTDAFEAVALQHEIDHTSGLLFLDRVAGAHALHARQTYL
ncbi:MAG TPA: peptide deformylase [Actinomycetales bacterium]|nr:peptide deformylase [Actinomycetales bacterium]